MSLLEAGQNDVAHPLCMKELVDELVHMHQLKLSISVLTLDFSVVVVQRLQVFVAIHCCAS